MCLIKAPKVAPAATSTTPAPILRNPFLDGLAGVQRSQRLGVSALTVQRAQPGQAAPSVTAGQTGSPYVVARPATSPTTGISV